MGQYGRRPCHFIARPASEAFRLVMPEWFEVGVELGDVGVGKELRIRSAEDASCVGGEVQSSDLLPGLSSCRGVCGERCLDGVGEGR